MPAPRVEASADRAVPGGLMRALRFLATGGVGFLVDAGVLSLLLATTSIGPILARCISFPVAFVVTWLLNRSWSFGDRPRPKLGIELGAYSAVQGIGFAINFGAYSFLVSDGLGVLAPPLVALFVGALISAVVTYLLLNSGLYRKARTPAR